MTVSPRTEYLCLSCPISGGTALEEGFILPCHQTGTFEEALQSRCCSRGRSLVPSEESSPCCQLDSRPSGSSTHPLTHTPTPPSSHPHTRTCLHLHPQGVLKLADFGVATRLSEAAEALRTNNPDVVGTPYWMAPEVIGGWRRGVGRKGGGDEGG